MTTRFDPVAYEENVKARAAAAEEAALAEQTQAEVFKNPPRHDTFGPVWGFTKKLPKNLSKAMYLALLNTAETLDDIGGVVGGPPGPTMSEEQGLDVEKMQELPTVTAQDMFPEVFESAHAFADNFNEDATTADFITQGIGQFVIPFTGWLKAVGGLKNASKMQKIGRAVTAEAATAGSAFQPQEGRVADLLSAGRQMENDFGRLLNTIAPDESAFNAYINTMTDRENEGKWEGRFKNIVDSLVMTGAGAALVKAVPTTLRAARQMAEEIGTVQAGSPKAQRGSVGVPGDELTDIERARALKNTVVEEVEGEHIVLEGDDLNTDADIVPIDKDKK